MWRKKTDKRITATGIAIIAALIGYGAWRDTHPDLSPHPSTLVAFPTYIWADDNSDAALVKADSALGGVFWIGDVAGDPPSFKSSGIEPKVLPQQETMPMLVLTEIPHSLSALFELVRSPIRAWVRTGNIVNDIFIDYRNDHPDLDALSPLVSGLRTDLEREQWIIVGLMRGSADMTPEMHTKLANMLKYIELYTYRLDDIQRPMETLEQTLRRLETENLPFMLHVHEKPDYAALTQAFPQGVRNFGGFIIDAPQTTLSGSKK